MIRFKIDPEDPEHLINRMNSRMRNALYIAAVNGNVRLVRWLLSAKANANIKSRVDEKRMEKPIVGAIRF